MRVGTVQRYAEDWMVLIPEPHDIRSDTVHSRIKTHTAVWRRTGD